MSEELQSKTQALIKDIEAKDRRFRLALGVFAAILFIGVVTLLALGYQLSAANSKLITTANQTLTNQSKVLNQLQSVSKARTDQISELQQHIDCIVALFGSPDRSKLVISDIEQCKLSNATNLSASTSALPQAATKPSAAIVRKTTASPKPSPSSSSPPKVTKSTQAPFPISLFQAIDDGLEKLVKAL